MRIATQKHLFKKSFNGKARGCIDFIAMLDRSGANIAGSICGDYDYICDFDVNNIKKAMKVLFNEDVTEEKGVIAWEKE